MAVPCLGVEVFCWNECLLSLRGPVICVCCCAPSPRPGPAERALQAHPCCALCLLHPTLGHIPEPCLLFPSATLLIGLCWWSRCFCRAVGRQMVLSSSSEMVWKALVLQTQFLMKQASLCRYVLAAGPWTLELHVTCCGMQLCI